MQVFLLNTLTTWQFLLYLTLLMTVMATLIFILTKRMIHVSFHKHNKELFTLAISIIIANYGFLLGFIIINLWQDIGHAMTLVSEEAAQLSIIVSDCFAFSSDFQHQFLNAVGQYIKYVVQDEWETMRWGNPSVLAQNAMQNIYHVVQSYIPQGKKEEIYYLDLISHLDLVLENRRLRLDAVSSILIGPLRFIMVLGAIFIIFFISLLKIKSTFTHWFVLMVVSFVISFNIALALMIDYPFSGEITISSDPFEEGNLSRFKEGSQK